MLTINENSSLQNYNTFHLDVNAKYFVEVKSEEEVRAALQHPQLKDEPKLVIGRGANILFTKDFDGVVIHMAIRGKKIVAEDEESVTLTVGAGEDWPELVMWAVDQGWAGIENLADIPGEVGAAPIQNIAAYGAEFADVFVSLEAINIHTLEKKTFDKEACHFRYRMSIFKEGLKQDYIITKVTMKLPKESKLDTSYYDIGTTAERAIRSVQSELDKIAQPPYTAKDLALAVTNIRSLKLPHVDEVGTVGSVFENPFVTREQLNKLLEKFPNMQYYPIDKMQYPKMDDPKLQNAEWLKIPAAWLIDGIGWRGKRVGNVGISEKHALCAVAYAGAKPEEMINLLQQVMIDVKNEYGIELEYEVNLV